MATIGNLWINIKANTRSLQRGVGGAKNSLAAFGKFMMNPAVLGVAAVTAAIVVWAKLGKAIVSGLVSAVKESAKFNQSMAKVGAVTMKTGKEFDVMRKKALDLGRTSVFTADQVASGMLALARAGLDGIEVIKSIEGVTDLAAAADMDLAEASGAVVNAMRAFGLQAEDTTHIADVFAITMSRSNTTVLEMADAMAYVAPVARALGFSIEHVSAMIGVLADAGIKGSMAGTGLRRVMSALASEIEEHGVRALDDWITAQHTVSEDLLKFGRRGFNVTQVLALMRKKMLELGEAGITASDVVKKMAEMRMDTLEGDFIRLKSAVSGFKIVVGDELEPALRQVTEVATHLVNAMTSAFVEWLAESDSLVFSTRELERIVENLIVTAGMGIAAMVQFFNESIREARILFNVGQILTGLWDAIKGIADGKDPWGAMTNLSDMKTDVMDIKDAIEKGWLGEGGASVDDLFDRVLKKFRENRDKLQKEIKATANKKGNLFLESLGLTGGAEGLKDLDEATIKILDKMSQFGEKLNDQWDFHGWEKFEIDAHKAIEVLKKMGGEEGAIEQVKAMVERQRLITSIVEAEAEVNALIQTGNNTWNEGLSILDTYNFQLNQLNETTKVLELSAEEYSRAWAGAMDNLIKKGQALTDELRTPLEKYKDDLKDLEGLMDFGFISEDTFSRAVAKLEKELSKNDVTLGVDTASAVKDLTEGLQTALGTVKVAGQISETEMLAKKSASTQAQIEILTRAVKDSSEDVSTNTKDAAKSLSGTLKTDVDGLQNKIETGVSNATISVQGMSMAYTEALIQTTNDLNARQWTELQNVNRNLIDLKQRGSQLT